MPIWNGFDEADRAAHMDEMQAERDSADEADDMNEVQRTRLAALCVRYGVPFQQEHYRPAFDLPAGYVAGWVGGPEHRKLYVGVSPEGDISS